MINVKYAPYFTLLSALFLTGCATTRIGIVHDYVFERAKEACADHQGLHYIVSVNKVKSDKEYSCEDNYVFRCQDQAAVKFNSGVIWCGISEMQLEETLKGK
jgi:uncharacterized lipoprotein YmbA